MFFYIAAAMAFFQQVPAASQAETLSHEEIEEIAGFCAAGEACDGEVQDVVLNRYVVRESADPWSNYCNLACRNGVRPDSRNEWLSRRSDSLGMEGDSASRFGRHDELMSNGRSSRDLRRHVIVDLCRVSRSVVGGATSRAVTQSFQRANYPVHHQDASDSLQVFVGQRPSRQQGEKARYQVRVDLSAVPTVPPTTGLCAVRVEARLCARIPPGAWRSERDDFSIQIADAVYRNLTTLAP